jgi:[ribosomal protein S18]-alanine N-acetyltransferase
VTDAASQTEAHPVARAVVGDAAALASLARASELPGWSEESLRAAFADPTMIARVTRSSDRSAQGFVVARRVADEVEILLVAVTPASRRRGAGTALVASALADAARAGAVAAHLEVRASNATAIALYERLGFVAVGRRPRYYDATEDAVLMSRALGGESS